MSSRSLRFAIPGLLLAGVISAATAQVPDQRQLNAVFQEMMVEFAKNDAAINRSIDETYGRDLSPEKRAAARRVTVAISLHEKLPSRMTALLLESPRGASNQELSSLGARLRSLLEAYGTLRLPTSRKAEKLRQIMDLAGALSPDACVRLLAGTEDPRTADRLHKSYLKSISLEQFESILQLKLDAMDAELDGNPPLEAISEEQAKVAATATYNALRVRSERWTEEMQKGFADRNGSSASVRCNLYREELQAMLDLEEPQLTWQLTAVFSGVAPAIATQEPPAHPAR